LVVLGEHPTPLSALMFSSCGPSVCVDFAGLWSRVGVDPARQMSEFAAPLSNASDTSHRMQTIAQCAVPIGIGVGTPIATKVLRCRLTCGS
jgi:hypothetical protein